MYIVNNSSMKKLTYILLNYLNTLFYSIAKRLCMSLPFETSLQSCVI